MVFQVTRIIDISTYATFIFKYFLRKLNKRYIPSHAVGNMQSKTLEKDSLNDFWGSPRQYNCIEPL